MKNYPADLHRPGYRFVAPGEYAVPGDPNGAFFAAGPIQQIPRPVGYGLPRIPQHRRLWKPGKWAKQQ